MNAATEANLDALVGPTHNYAGLSFGNVASEMHAGRASNPRAAALQGLSKMRLLMQLGLPQLVMPPHPRPDFALLRRLGFTNIAQAANSAPELLPHFYSSSGMWAANAATVCPSGDAADGRMHFTPANLISTPHRATEAAFSACALQRIFPHPDHFCHHAPLPASALFADEGAANHMRLETKEGNGLHLFVYGRDGARYTPTRYPARQALAASQAVARLHGIHSEQALFLRQNPAAIDAGVFHNDVIATSHREMLLYHEAAFAEGDALLRALPLAHVIRVAASQLSLQEAVRTYLFNSQIIHTPQGYGIIAPAECAESLQARAALDSLPLQHIHYVDLRESMQNGGGPACLRLRVTLTEHELAAVHPGVVLTEALYTQLCAWVNTHYRDRLRPDDLRDPALAEEAHAALAELAVLLQLPDLYAV